MNDLVIRKPYVDGNRLCADIYLSDKEGSVQLWYEVDAQYIPYLCVERSDAFLVNLLLYAMENSYNIICEQCVSEKLYYQLTEYLIPAISKNTHSYSAISITSDLSSVILPSAHAVGGSISGGVDSFFTALKHYNRKEEHYNITHYAFFNAGASGMYGGEDARSMFKDRLKWIEEVAIEQGKPIVAVDTNINEFLHQKHIRSHTFRSLAIPLALQKLFSIYYYSSGVPFTEFEIGEEDTAPYDLLSMNCLNTENITFYSHGGDVTRIEKLKYISEYPVTHKYLNVCIKDATNCCRCEKCRRTMIELYVLGKLEEYSSVFNLRIFNTDKKKIIFEAIKRKNDHDWHDIYIALKESNEITLATVLLSKVYFFVKSIIVKNDTLSTAYSERFYKNK